MLRNPGISVREITARLDRQSVINPNSGKAYTYQTVQNDIQYLRQQWRERTARDVDEWRAEQIAELHEHRKAAWGEKNLSEVRLGLVQEAKLMGTEAVEKHDVTSKGERIIFTIGGLSEGDI